MKLFLPITLLAVAVSAQSTAATPGGSKCEADYIVTRCLESEEAKAAACKSDDYDCQCAAYEAIATCYNNCPDDSRAANAKGQVTIFCQNASLYGSKATKPTSIASGSQTAATVLAKTTTTAPTGTAKETVIVGTATTSSSPDSTAAAADLTRNSGAVLLMAAGAVAALF